MDIFDKSIVARTELPENKQEIELECGHRQTYHKEVANVLTTSYCGACVNMFLAAARDNSQLPSKVRSAGK